MCMRIDVLTDYCVYSHPPRPPFIKYILQALRKHKNRYKSLEPPRFILLVLVHLLPRVDGPRQSVNAIRLAIGHGGLGQQQGELPTGASTDDLLFPDRRVVNQRGNVDIVESTLSGLVVAGETPRVDLSVLGYSKAVVRSSRDRGNVRDVYWSVAAHKEGREDSLSWTVGLTRIRGLPLSS